MPNFTSLVANLLLKFFKNKMLWEHKIFHSHWRTNIIKGINQLYFELENYQALHWWIFQTGNVLWETATLSITFLSNAECSYICNTYRGSSDRTKVEPRYVCSSYPPLSAKVPFVISKLANGTIRGLKAKTKDSHIS